MHPKNKLERRKIAIKKQEAPVKKKWVKLADLKEAIDGQVTYQDR